MQVADSNKTARLISTIFVPPSFTIILFTLFAFLYEEQTYKTIIQIITAFSFGFIFHIILFFYLRRKGKLADKDASLKEERTFPYAIAVLFYLAGLIILLYFEMNHISIAFWFCYISNTILILLINKFWKISAHTMGAAGSLAVVLIQFNLYAVIPFVIVILVGWSRIRLKQHTLTQVLAGGITGFVSTYIQIKLILEILTTII